nr:MAG TPA: hypothetical protein [Caudoviricetes sp.]DAV60088.1 MAG TPA: hypothetical protein [Caudoviricetes sp.]
MGQPLDRPLFMFLEQRYMFILTKQISYQIKCLLHT